jgi:hypothetical protein
MEVTVDAAGTTPAEFPRMSPLKQTEITDLVNSGAWSPYDATAGGDGPGMHGFGTRENPDDPNGEPIQRNVDPVTGSTNAPRLSRSNYYSQYDPTAYMPPVDTGLDVDKPEEKEAETPRQTLIKSADTGEAPPPVQTVIDIPDGTIDASSKPEGVISDTKKTGDDIGKFIGPGESRERMRSVKYRTNQQQRLLRQESSEIKRGNIKAIRDRDDISREEKQKLIKSERQSHKDTMRGGREAKRDARRAEMERQARTEKYSYKTMQGSGESPIKMWGSAKQNYGSKSSPNKARSPYKMGGYGSKNK